MFAGIGVKRAATLGFCRIWAGGEVPVTTEPGDQMAAAAAGGRLRASDADREQVIDTLKAVLCRQAVQGRASRAGGPTFASRTYAELAALTADLPLG